MRPSCLYIGSSLLYNKGWSITSKLSPKDKSPSFPYKTQYPSFSYLRVEKVGKWLGMTQKVKTRGTKYKCDAFLGGNFMWECQTFNSFCGNKPFIAYGSCCRKNGTGLDKSLALPYWIL